MAVATLKLDDSRWRSFLGALRGKVHNPAPFLLALAKTQGFADIQQHFRDEKGPDGSWKPWSPGYAEFRRGGEAQAIKKRKSEGRPIRKPVGGKILQLSGALRNSLLPGKGGSRIVDRFTVELFPSLSANIDYSATHEYGDPKRNIPARPFMWLSERVQRLMAASLSKWLSEAK